MNIISFIISKTAGILLFICAIFLTIHYIISSDYSFSILTYAHPTSEITRPQYSQLLRGNKVQGQITAQDDYLGILLMRFNTFNRENEDVIRFRIRQKGQKTWFHVKDVNAAGFSGLDLYPFGFPTIIHSRGHIYEFEFESLLGTKDNSVALSKKYNLLYSKYQYPRKEITKNNSSMLSFGIKKTMNAIAHFNLLYVVFVYFLPFLIYLNRSWLITIICKPLLNRAISGIDYLLELPMVQKNPVLRIVKIFLTHAKHLLDTFPFVVLLVGIISFDIVAISFYSDIIVFILVSLWIYSCVRYHLTPRVTSIIAVVLLFATPICYFWDGRVAQKTAIWSYLFLWISILAIVSRHADTLFSLTKANATHT